jgi:hypothetical protein
MVAFSLVTNAEADTHSLGLHAGVSTSAAAAGLRFPARPFAHRIKSSWQRKQISPRNFDFWPRHNCLRRLQANSSENAFTGDHHQPHVDQDGDPSASGAGEKFEKLFNVEGLVEDL